MCAILSWVQSPLREEQGVTNTLLRELFYGASHWGTHSVGLVTYQQGKEELFKKAVTPAKFLKNSNHRIERAAGMEKGIGHTRYATHGALVDRNAHPFQHFRFDAACSHLTYAHNGVIHNYQDVGDQFHLGRLHVDSECLGALIDARQLHRAEGSNGLVWLDQGRIFCYRSGQGLNAYTVRTKENKVFTLVMSREAMLKECHSLFKATVSETYLQPGVAYQVHQDHLTVAWNEPGRHESKRPARRGGVYAGG